MLRFRNRLHQRGPRAPQADGLKLAEENDFLRIPFDF